MVYTFAFLSAPPPQQKPRGLRDEAIDYVVVGELAAAVDPGVSLEALQQSDERLLEAVVRHDQVICNLCQEQTVLPLRFGTVFISESRLREHLSQHQRSYQSRLQALRGAGEYLFKAWVSGSDADPQADDGGPSLSGRAYLLAKKQQYERQQQRQQQQEAESEDLVRQLQAQVPGPIHPGQTQGEEILRLYLLLHTDEAEALTQGLQQWQQARPHWQVRLEGPLPPYHFADADEQSL